jgi:photosystem II stability/assembly factor-like uncharacterized protein
MKETGLIILLALWMMGCTSTIEPFFTFTELQSPTEASIRGLSVVNEHCLWISGSGGTVMRSTNSGETWLDCSIKQEADNDFRSIHAIDSLHAYVIGVNNPAKVYCTSDGGRSWETADSISAQGLFFNSLKFAGKERALAVSDPTDGYFYVLKTTDGGYSWHRVTTLPPALDGESNFAASNTCIEYLEDGSAWMVTGGPEARVYYSKDDGNNWHVVATPVKAGTNANGIYSIAFENKQNGIAVGGSYISHEENDSIAAYSHDGGLNWQLAQTMPSGFRSCIQYFTLDGMKLAIAMGKTGFDYSVDGGVNWHFGGSDGYYTIRAVPGQAGGYAAGSNGRVAHVKITINK